MLQNMSVDQINANTRTEDMENSFKHIYDTTNAIITQIPVEWGTDAADKAEKAASGSDTSSSSSSTTSANGTTAHVDEDEDGYDDNTDEWIGFGDDDEDEGLYASDDDEAETDTGYVDEDGDGYDDWTGDEVPDDE
mgnify:CR=1 FL=1